MDVKSKAPSPIPIPALAAGFVFMSLINFVPAGGIVSALCVLIAPAAFLYAHRQCETKKQCFIVLLVFAAGLTMMNLRYSPSRLLDIVVFTLSAAFISPAFMLDRRFGSGESRSFITTLIFPAVWTSLFHISTAACFGFQFRLDAYVTALRSLIQIESIIGSAGVMFLILWTASVVVYILESGRCASVAGVVVWALVMLGSTLFGAVRLQLAASDAPVVKMAYATGPYVGDYVDYTELEYEQYAQSITNSVTKAADGGAELILFNEEAFFFSLDREEEFNSLVSQLAKDNGIFILSGEEVKISSEDKSDNRISFYGPDGQLIFRYSKHSLIPVIEAPYCVNRKDPLPSADVSFSSGTVKLSAAICYDCDFSTYVAGIPCNTDLLLAPSWDWLPVMDYHRETGRELAIENGFTLLKNTYDGYSCLFNPLGETLATSHTSVSGFEQVNFVDVPLQSEVTLYNRLGSCYGYVITAVTAAAMILLEIKKRTNGKECNK